MENSRRLWLCIHTFSVALLLCVAPTLALAHKGSPWHANDIATAVGVNTLKLELPPGVAVAKFRVRYPVQPNKLDYAVGDSSTVVIVNDEDLKRDGFVTEKNATFAMESPAYDPGTPLTGEFEIKKSGYYHVMFGPGRNTSILVLEPSLTVAVEPITSGATAGAFVAPATSGDFHILKNANLGMREFAGWFAVFFEEYQKSYDQLGLATASSLRLEGERAGRFAEALYARGFTSFQNFSSPGGAITAPFLGHVNGLSVEAVDAVYLEPGDYEFLYKPRMIRHSIIRTNEIILQVVKDASYTKGYGTDADVIARREIPSSNTEFRLPFQVKDAGYYHLSYGPGEGGFIFHMTADDALPTEVVTKRGLARDHAKLVAINSVVVGARPLGAGQSWQVFFPCKVVAAKAAPRKLLSSVRVPLNDDVALAVARLGAAVMHPIMMESMRTKLDLQRREILRLNAQPK